MAIWNIQNFKKLENEPIFQILRFSKIIKFSLLTSLENNQISEIVQFRKLAIFKIGQLRKLPKFQKFSTRKFIIHFERLINSNKNIFLIENKLINSTFFILTRCGHTGVKPCQL